MTRPAKVIIDGHAAKKNLETTRLHCPQSRILAVIKADAYGHGLLRMARIFNEADAFAVASLDEAVTLREAGCRHRIVLLEGPFEFDEIAIIDRLDLDVVIHSFEQISMLEHARAILPVWIKINTGMNRLGFDADAVAQVHHRLSSTSSSIIFMTHFANAQVRGDVTVGSQLTAFDTAIFGYPEEQSLANSSALLTCTNTQRHWVRPGLMLYGVSPLHGETARSLGLLPVMTLKSRLISVRDVKAGRTVGYGGSYVCPYDMKVGVVAYGYGDGYPRSANTGTPVLVNNVKTQVIGECSMDMMTVQLPDSAEAKFGDEVTLWGGELPIEEVAKASGTIPYELLCRARMRARYEEVGL